MNAIDLRFLEATRRHAEANGMIMETDGEFIVLRMNVLMHPQFCVDNTIARVDSVSGAYAFLSGWSQRDTYASALGKL